MRGVPLRPGHTRAADPSRLRQLYLWSGRSGRGVPVGQVARLELSLGVLGLASKGDD